MRKALWLLTLPLAAAGYVSGCHPTPANEREPGRDLLELVRKADFIFEGEVIRVEYKNSRPLAAGLRKDTVVNSEEDEIRSRLVNSSNGGVLEDLGEVPHTFVTYLVVQPFKGNFDNTTEVTLRFAGGVNTSEKITRVNPNDFSVEETFTMSHISEAPQIDIGDRDFVFAHRNGQKACPLADCEIGRLRVLRAPGDEEDFMFNEWGSEVHQLEDVRGDALLHYPFERQIPEVNTHFVKFPNGVVRKLSIVDVAATNEGDGPRGSAGSSPIEATPASAGSVDSSQGYDRHQTYNPGPDAPKLVEKPSTDTRITPEALTWMLVKAVDDIYPGGMESQAEPVSVDISQDFSISYFKGEISTSDPVEQDRPASESTPTTLCGRVEAAVMSEVRRNPQTGEVDPDADVSPSPEQIRRIQDACADERPVGEGE